MYNTYSMIDVHVLLNLGQRFSNSFNEISSEIFAEFDWYLLPIKMQQMLPIIIIHSHQPVDIRFFGSISCSRIQFQKVSRQVK